MALSDNVMVRFAQDGSIIDAWPFFGPAARPFDSLSQKRYNIAAPRPVVAGQPATEAQIVSGFVVVNGELGPKV